MNSAQAINRKIVSLVVTVALAATVVMAQQNRGSLRGLVTDELGAAIVGATITLTDASGAQKKTTTSGEGVYTFTGLMPGKYVLQATAAGFANAPDREVDITTQRQTVDITLKITIEEKVTVDTDRELSTDTSANANQQVIKGSDLDALPDDPDELAAALQALAGPSAGPNGGQIFVDGFSGNSLPSKDSIREIRINQNPFSAENDQPSGRIDILTRPGTDKLRGAAGFNFNDESFNSRNPFVTRSPKRTPFQFRQYNFNLSGPIVARKASFFFDFNRNETDDNELVRATVVDPNLNIVDAGQTFLVPRRGTNLSGRFDYAINPKNTLVSRYNFNRSRTTNQGIGGFSLPERAYDNVSTFQGFQITETAVLNATTINETRFQFNHSVSESLGDNSFPVLNVSGAFISGSSGVGHLQNTRNNWELSNFTAVQHGTHAIKFGGRVRGVNIDDTNPNNFGGTWFFTGGFGLTSIQRYQLTLDLQKQGKTPEEIRALKGGASQFTISTGNPVAGVTQRDYGLFIQDDWRARPNLTLSAGLRYEYQTNAASKYNFAPRVALAWSPGAANSARPPKMVIRVGAGIFYNRFGEFNTLQANRLNGERVLSYAITEETGRINPPTIDQQNAPTVAAAYKILNSFDPDSPASVADVSPVQQTIWLIDPNLQIPTVYVLGTQVERQLPRNITMTVGFYNIKIQHVIRGRDINAPLPGSIIPVIRPGGIRPDPTRGEINQYEASGRYNQRQFFVGFNSRLSRTITLQGNYSYSRQENDTDGQGSGGFPVNSYDLTGEYGRGGFDVRHRFSVFGSIIMPWRVSLNPFIIANTGPGFNITTGQDLNLDRQYNERPSFAGPNPNCQNEFIKCTKFGNFNIRPLPGETIIPRNYGQAPGSLSVNVRVSRTFQFGVINRTAAAPTRAAAPTSGPAASSSTQTASALASGSGPSAGGGEKRVVTTGGAGGPAGPGGPTVAGAGGGGAAVKTAAVGAPPPQGGGGAARSEYRYSLNVSLSFQNVLNRVNLSTPVGNLSSPNFGQSLGLNNFGGFGGGGSSGAGNRRIYAQVRLNF
ncbi:MAG TPA: TonB-dependent receptor [Pyrinomonadaceae bacterium]